MAAPIKKCVVCFKIISDRSYRSLSSDTSKEQYRDVFKLLGIPDLNGFACNVCCNKLNRIQKLTIDLKTKVISIKEEREKLISTVRGMIGIQTLEKENNPVSTPKGTKRPFNVIKLTPTPKSKVKKGLFASPSAEKVVKPLNCHAVLKSKTVQSDDKSTQTKDRSEEFDVKVVVKYNGVERLKIIKEEHEKAALKSLLNNASPRAVLRNFSLCENYKREMLDIVKSVIQDEIKQLSKNDCEIFKGNGSNNEKLINFDMKHTSQQLQLKAPYLYQIFSSAILLQEKKNLPQMLSSIAVLLYGRSQTTNRLQYILGLTLQKCGLNREGINIIHDLGMSVSSSSLHKKTKQLVKQQESQLHSLMTSYVEEVENKQRTGDENPTEVEMDTDGVHKKQQPIEILGYLSTLLQREKLCR
ncbi:uncharacterized protein LOC111117593 [Crassostrea virginica]